VQTGSAPWSTGGPLILIDQRTVPHAGLGTGPGVVRASVAVDVLTCLALIWLALSYIIWCIRSGNSERLFQRRGFWLG
jgi:hypothetical protein